jgi:hypothetical protein
MKFPFFKKKEEIVIEKKPYIKMDVFYKNKQIADTFSYPIDYSKENTGEGIFDDFCKWFCNQKSQTYIFYWNKGFVIFIRSEIIKISVYKIEK